MDTTLLEGVAERLEQSWDHLTNAREDERTRTVGSIEQLHHAVRLLLCHAELQEARSVKSAVPQPAVPQPNEPVFTVDVNIVGFLPGESGVLRERAAFAVWPPMEQIFSDIQVDEQYEFVLSRVRSSANPWGDYATFSCRKRKIS